MIDAFQDDNGSHVFVGTEQARKEWDCVLIYNDEVEVSI